MDSNVLLMINYQKLDFSEKRRSFSNHFQHKSWKIQQKLENQTIVTPVNVIEYELKVFFVWIIVK